MLIFKIERAVINQCVIAQSGQYSTIMLESKIYTLSPYRYVLANVYLIATLVNCLPMQTFSSINVAVEKLFNISSTEVTLNALLFNVAHPIFAFPCNWLLNRFGMHKCFILGGIFVISGVWLRLLIQEGSSTFVLMGSALCAFGNIFIINTPSKFATNWFPIGSANLITFLAVSFTILSASIGAAAPGFFINENTSTVQDVRRLLLIQAIIVSIPILLLMILFRDHPEHPPSKAAEIIVNQKRQNYRHLLKKLFRNKEYLKIMAAAAFNNGSLNAILAILDQAIKGMGYTNSSSVVSKIVISVVVVGVISNPIFSIVLKKSNAYRLLTSATALGTCIAASLAVTGFVFQVNTTIYLLILGGMIGLFIVPILSMFIMYGSQLAFPIDEGSSAGYIMASCQTFGFILGFSSIRLLDKSKERSELVLYTLCGFLFLSFVFVLWVKENLKKLEYEQGKSSDQKENITETLIVPEVEMKK